MKKKPLMQLMLAAAAMGMTLPTFDDFGGRNPKKCNLPSCDKLTYHNGGYCCAEHCKQHRGK